MRPLLQSAAGLFFSLALLPAMAQQQEVGQTVLIGVATQLAIPPGQTTRDAVQLAVDRANQQGLHIGGKKVTLKVFVVDDKNDVHLAALGARAAIAAGVAGVIGHLSTDASIAAAKIYSDAGIPQLSPTAAGREFTQQGYPTSFQMLGHSVHTAQYLAETAVKVLRARHILLIDNDTVLGRELARYFSAAVARLGGSIVAQEKINAKSSDFNSVIARIKSSDADLVFFAGVVPQSTALAIRLQQLGLHTKLLLASGALNPGFPHKTEELPEGTLALVQGSPPAKAAGVKGVEQQYQQKYGAPLTPFTWLAFDAADMLIEAMRRSDSTDPRTLTATLHRLKFNGVSGPIGFNPDGSLENPTYTLYRAEQPGWKMLNTMP